MIDSSFQRLCDLNLVIIGAGAWGNKLFSIFESRVRNCSLVSARDFLMSPVILDTLNLNAIFWVSTRPDLQIRILSKLINDNVTKVILEKPYFANLEDFYKLERSLARGSQTSVFLSEPWRHSALWKDVKTVILDLHSNSEKTQIQIYRLSSEKREFINPIQDWMPHDLSLIFDLRAQLESCQLELFKASVVEENKMEGDFTLGNKLRVNFSIGYETGPRTAKWLISNDDKLIDVDFVGLRIESNLNVWGIPRIDYAQDYPLVNQLQWIASRVSDKDVMNKLLLQKEFLY